jgi:hypothetical protein
VNPHDHIVSGVDDRIQADGAYSRFVSPLIGLVWIVVVSRVLLSRSPATRAGWWPIVSRTGADRKSRESRKLGQKPNRLGMTESVGSQTRIPVHDQTHSTFEGGIK